MADYGNIALAPDPSISAITNYDLVPSHLTNAIDCLVDSGGTLMAITSYLIVGTTTPVLPYHPPTPYQWPRGDLDAT
jgi:hypothetical protein